VFLLDNAGRPISWVNWQEAVNLYVREQVAWSPSETTLRCFGGTCQKTGLKSFLDLSTIIAIRGARPKHNPNVVLR